MDLWIWSGWLRGFGDRKQQQQQAIETSELLISHL